jgi:hypothetical protein
MVLNLFQWLALRGVFWRAACRLILDYNFRLFRISSGCSNQVVSIWAVEWCHFSACCVWGTVNYAVRRSHDVCCVGNHIIFCLHLNSILIELV